MPRPVIHYVESTDSTMLEARRLVEAASGAPHSVPLSGTVVQAGYQTAGRGRVRERRWESSPGESLLFTVIYSRTDLERRMSGRSFTLLPLLCGLAVAEAVEQYIEKEAPAASVPDIRIKWPNDVLADGRKLCGILCEASGDWIYAGIGINLNQGGFNQELRRPACSVSMLSGGRADGDELLKTILLRLEQTLGCEQWRDEIALRLYHRGDEVCINTGLAEEITDEPVIIKGILSGIDTTGALLLDTSEGEIPVFSGELQV